MGHDKEVTPAPAVEQIDQHIDFIIVGCAPDDVPLNLGTPRHRSGLEPRRRSRKNLTLARSSGKRTQRYASFVGPPLAAGEQLQPASYPQGSGVLCARAKWIGGSKSRHEPLKP